MVNDNNAVNLNRGLYEAVWDAYPAITVAKTVDIDGALSYAFQNRGTTTAILNDLWTVLPNSVQHFNVFMPNMVINTKIRVKFTGAGTNNLEVSAMRLKGPAFSNFTKDDPTY